MRRILLILLLAFLTLQLFQVDSNVSSENFKTDVLNLYPAHDSIELLLNGYCYDCHSNNTNYPWFANIQPAGWFVQKNVNEGKKHLNFSEFGNYSKDEQKKKMQEIVEVMEKNTMPIDSYQWYKKTASLKEDQRRSIINWAKQIESNTPTGNLTTDSGYIK